MDDDDIDDADGIDDDVDIDSDHNINDAHDIEDDFDYIYDDEDMIMVLMMILMEIRWCCV